MIGTPIAWAWVNTKEQSIIGDIAIDNTLLFACNPAIMPKTVPRNGLWDVQITGTEIDGGFGSTAYPPSSPINFADPQNGYVCRFVNYGNSALLNVEVDLKISYMESVKMDNGSRSSVVIKTRKWITPRVNVGNGENNYVETYYRNRSESFVNIEIPSTVRAQAVHRPDWQTVKLIPPRFQGFGMAPYVPPINPPNEAPLVPAPLSTPAEK